jgi:hypothetical protein
MEDQLADARDEGPQSLAEALRRPKKATGQTPRASDLPDEDDPMTSVITRTTTPVTVGGVEQTVVRAAKKSTNPKTQAKNTTTVPPPTQGVRLSLDTEGTDYVPLQAASNSSQAPRSAPRSASSGTKSSPLALGQEVDGPNPWLVPEAKERDARGVSKKSSKGSSKAVVVGVDLESALGVEAKSRFDLMANQNEAQKELIQRAFPGAAVEEEFKLEKQQIAEEDEDKPEEGILFLLLLWLLWL